MATPKQVIKPPALCPGDTVAVIAPASPIDSELLVTGCEVLRAMGYKPIYEDSILDADLYLAGSVERRARELNAAFERDDIKAIICARGGYGCNYLLPHIDIDLIRRHPKVFVGYSDVTTLLTWFHDATGLVTFHGPMVTKDFALPHGADLPSWHAKLAGDPELQSTALLTPITNGRAVGKLYGGCLSMLAASLGTPYEIHTEGTILLIEDVAAKPYQIDRMLMQLKLAGKLRGVRGVVFGCMKECEPPPGCNYTLIDVIRRVIGDLGVPIAFGINSGHVDKANLTLPIGVQATLTVDHNCASLSITEAAVSGC